MLPCCVRIGSPVKKATGYFIHPRTERLRQRVVFVFKYGVLGWGVACAVVMFVIQSYQANGWLGPRDFVPSLVTWAAMGVVFGLLQLDRAERRDNGRRVNASLELVNRGASARGRVIEVLASSSSSEMARVCSEMAWREFQTMPRVGYPRRFARHSALPNQAFVRQRSRLLVLKVRPLRLRTSPTGDAH